MVDDRERRWIDDNMRWLSGQFGSADQNPVVLPTDEFFPGVYQGTDDDVCLAVDRVCAYMGVDATRISVDLDDYDAGAEVRAGLPAYVHSTHGVAGHYRVVDGSPVITLSNLRHKPLQLVATIAHELAHDRLIGEGRIDPDRPHGEPLADLTTVYLGMGLFTANAAFEFANLAGLDSSSGLGLGQHNRFSTSRLGYLTEPMFGYALAVYAHRRGESNPQWARYLDTNPRHFLRKALRSMP